VVVLVFVVVVVAAVWVVVVGAVVVVVVAAVVVVVIELVVVVVEEVVVVSVVEGPRDPPGTAARAVATPRMAITTAQKESPTVRLIVTVWGSSCLLSPADLGG